LEKFLASPLVILAYIPLLFIAAAIVSRGSVLLVYFFMPHYALLIGVPVALVLGGIAYGVIEGLGHALRSYNRLTFTNLLAAGAGLSMLLGFLPWQLDRRPIDPWGVLFEDYAASLVFFAVMIYLMMAGWWVSYSFRRVEERRISWAAIFAALGVASLPFAIFGMAQTSRLHDAVRSGDLDRVNAALKPWKSVDARNRNGVTPLDIAISMNRIDIGKLLLDRGASIQFPSASGTQIDHVANAVSYGRVNFVKLFMDRGAIYSAPALATAVQRDDPALVALLLEHGRFPPSVKNLNLASAIQRKSPSRFKVAEVLLQSGASFGAETSSGMSIMLWSLTIRDEETLRWLIQKGYPLNDLDRLGKGALHHAARTNGEMVSILIQAGADLNLVDREGLTPLATAVADGHLTNMLLLLQAGADPNAGRPGLKPVDLALRQRRDEDFLTPLRKASAKQTKQGAEIP